MKKLAILLLVLVVLLCGCSVIDEARVPDESNVIAEEQEILNDDGENEETVPGTPIDPESLLPDEKDVEEEAPVVEESEETTSQTVYRTESGECYHRSGCQYLKKSKIETTVDRAQAMGLRACSKCYPPQ